MLEHGLSKLSQRLDSVSSELNQASASKVYSPSQQMRSNTFESNSLRNMYDVERQRTDDDNSSQASENFDSLEVSLDHIVPESQNNALVSAVEQLPGNTSHPAPSTPLVMSSAD